MREILFRAKNAVTNKWAEGGYCHYDDIADHGRDDCDYIVEKHDGKSFPFIKINLETLGQYTGFNDRDDNKIFEGDIIRRWWGRKDFQNTVYVIRFKNGAFCAEYSDTNYCFPIDTMLKNKIEVIGNIYDNPELLKVVK